MKLYPSWWPKHGYKFSLAIGLLTSLMVGVNVFQHHLWMTFGWFVLSTVNLVGWYATKPPNTPAN